MSALNRIVDAFDSTIGENNNDDILTALDNIADAIENSSGSDRNDFVVTLSSMINEQTGKTIYIVDKTNSEIYNAASAGENIKLIRFFTDGDDISHYYYYKLNYVVPNEAQFSLIYNPEPGESDAELLVYMYFVTIKRDEVIFEPCSTAISVVVY